ncbi:MAG: sigma-70 family RNA polymerase sigma factor [Tissierella sp.]|nr:sigma-70 family RNA polymerase sigma factor [Tissierella sp.]
MYKELNELLIKAKNGDTDSAAQILNRVQGLIFNSIQRYYNDRNEYEDLIQEGNLVVLQAIEDFDESRGVYFLGYLKTMLKYTYLNKHNIKRHLSLNVAVGDDGENEWVDVLESDEEGIIERLLKIEAASELKDALEKLTDRQREVIMAYYFQRLSINDISKRLGITYRTVVNTKTRALEKLREWM